MMEFLDTPIFGILISIASFELGLFIYKKTRIPIFNLVQHPSPQREGLPICNQPKCVSLSSPFLGIISNVILMNYISIINYNPFLRGNPGTIWAEGYKYSSK